MSLSYKIKAAAVAAGFDLAGVAPVREFVELEAFPEWIADGHNGDMRYLEARSEAGELKRASLRSVAPWARSVIVCAMNYNTAYPYSTQCYDPARGWISRYAWANEDYHDSLLRRLKTVETKLHDRVVLQNSPAPEPSNSEPVTRVISRCYVDTGPLVERVYAKYAGVGWIGKNTCIINQQIGSWLFLGVILTSLELTPDLPAPDRCGTCTRCIDACPTNAFIAPHQLDATKCISYLTIEKRGSIPENLREGMGSHVFGCDICQDVCPWNRKAPASSATEFQPREGLVNPALDWLAEMQADEFRRVFRGSPIRRTKLTGLRRNAVIAMANSRQSAFKPLLKALSDDEDSIVAEHAKWALAELTSEKP